jgi:hypothetical protein
VLVAVVVIIVLVALAKLVKVLFGRKVRLTIVIMIRVLVAIANFMDWTMVPKIYKAAVRLLPNSPHEAARLELILPPPLLMMLQSLDYV